MADSKQGDLFGAAAPPAPRQDAKAPPQRAAPSPAPEPVKSEPVPAPPTRVPAWRREPPPLASRSAEVDTPRPPQPQASAGAGRKAEPKVLTVSQLTRQVKDALEPQFTRVLVRGEISNFRGVNARGHFFFALKDARASIDVKLWATTAQRLKFQLREGLSVVVEGSLDLYEPQGRYSLIIERLEPEGVGAQALAFEQLKQKLLAEGLIGERRQRRPLPFLPRRIGVVTSVSGAALRDFLKVLHRRHPRLSVLVADARVQGDGAVFELRRALRWMNRANVDVIVVTRGGGSADDLSTFNEEPVVRALAECRVPVVSAVGHEIDTTLCDLVADVRAPTPSAAAELLAPQLSDLEAALATARARLQRAVEKTLVHERAELRGLRAALGEPRRELSSQRLVIANAAERLASALRRRLRADGVGLRELGARLQTVRPEALLRQRRAELGSLRATLATLEQRRLRAEREQAARRSRERLSSALGRRVRHERAALRELTTRLQRARPQAALQARRAELSALRAALTTLGQRRLRGEREVASRLSPQRLAAAVGRRLRAEQLALHELALRLQRARPQTALQARRAELTTMRASLAALAQRQLRSERERAARLSRALERHSPRPVLTQQRHLLERQRERLATALRARLRRERERFVALERELDAYSPLEVLRRGYALARDEAGRLVRRADEVRAGQQLTLKLGVGELLVEVTKVKPT